MILLRCPKFLRCLTADAGNFDRGHSLTSLPLPLAALSSLPTSPRLHALHVTLPQGRPSQSPAPPRSLPRFRRGDPCGRPPISLLAKTVSLRSQCAHWLWQSVPRPLLHAKKEDASRHPLFFTIKSLENYFSSTLAPTSSSSFFMFSASSLDRASFRVVGVSSTAFLASARPRPVISRTDLMTLIF